MTKSRALPALLALVAAVSLLVVGGSSRAQQGDELTRRAVVPMLAADSAPGVPVELAVYFFLEGTATGGDGPFLVPVHREVPPTTGVARAAIEQLLAGLTTAESTSIPAISSTVPEGTQLLDISISSGVATVDLSEEFESGGGSASVLGRLAQLVFTLTQFPTVDSVVLEIEGEAVEVFSSEGVVIDGPLTREDFLDFAPSILVEMPHYGGPAGNPLRVTGIANVFEATFMLALVDNDGLVLADEVVMASCGTGCWGTFDVTVPYTVDEPQLGAVIVWFNSPQDGSQRDIREYPVWLTPGT